jgi:hypothetical protein
MVVPACNPSYSGDRGRRITAQGQPNKVSGNNLSEKQTKSTSSEGVVQVEECKHEMLGLMPSCICFLVSTGCVLEYLPTFFLMRINGN